MEWWLHLTDPPLPLVWARLRVYDDGTADACWEDGGPLYGFEARANASHFLSEDEYVQLANLDEDDELEGPLKRVATAPPTWRDDPDAVFEYLGGY